MKTIGLMVISSSVNSSSGRQRLLRVKITSNFDPFRRKSLKQEKIMRGTSHIVMSLNQCQRLSRSK